MGTEDNKKNVVACYERIFNDKDPEGAIAEFFGDDYIQHNPTMPDGSDAFVEFVHASLKRAPTTHVEVKRAIAEGDFVWTHSSTTSEGDVERALVNIWRLENGKIVEHWDVIQQVPVSAANSNTMF